jgi:hypothetical protein
MPDADSAFSPNHCCIAVSERRESTRRGYAIEKEPPTCEGIVAWRRLTEPIARTFDMVMCIEVLEYLDGAEAEISIASICDVTDVVLFSASSCLIRRKGA